MGNSVISNMDNKDGNPRYLLCGILFNQLLAKGNLIFLNVNLLDQTQHNIFRLFWQKYPIL